MISLSMSLKCPHSECQKSRDCKTFNKDRKVFTPNIKIMFGRSVFCKSYHPPKEDCDHEYEYTKVTPLDEPGLGGQQKICKKCGGVVFMTVEMENTGE